jgi:CheY-like chemotaxis protein
MPGMDGFETAAQIKRRGRLPDVPIIFLTAAGAEPELAFRGYAAGAVDYISKPFDPWVLRAKVSVFVDLYLKERQLRVVSDLSPLLSAIEEAAAGLAGLPAALASGALTDTTLADGLTQLNGAIASLRATLSCLPGELPVIPRGSDPS